MASPKWTARCIWMHCLAVDTNLSLSCNGLQWVVQVMYSVCKIIQSLFSSVEDCQKCNGIALENQIYNPTLYCNHRYVEVMQPLTSLPTNLASQYQVCINTQGCRISCIVITASQLHAIQQKPCSYVSIGKQYMSILCNTARFPRLTRRGSLAAEGDGRTVSNLRTGQSRQPRPG